MKCKSFEHHLLIVLIHIKLSLLCSSQILLLKPAPSGLHAGSLPWWNLASNAADKPLFQPLCWSGATSCRREVKSGALSRQTQSQHGLTVRRRGVALTVNCCMHHSLPLHNALGVPEDHNQKRTVGQLDICLWVNRNDKGTNTLSKTRLFTRVIALQTSSTQTGLEFKLLSS